jgi:hypothetical protein
MKIFLIIKFPNKYFFSTARGELFLFFTNGDLPILIGLFAGEAAALTSQLEEEIIVQRGMKALHSIFGNICPAKVNESIANFNSF